jgi:phosphonate transport system ATP-binding protein
VTSKQVMGDFLKINKELNITVIANMHHVDMALNYADRIIGIKEGVIVYDGPSKDVNNSILKQVYGRELSNDDLMEH